MISGTWRPLEADPAGQPGTDLEVLHNMPSCKSRFVRVSISTLIAKIIIGRWRLILGASQVQIWRSHAICFHVGLNIGC